MAGFTHMNSSRILNTNAFCPRLFYHRAIKNIRQHSIGKFESEYYPAKKRMRSFFDIRLQLFYDHVIENWIMGLGTVYAALGLSTFPNIPKVASALIPQRIVLR